MDASLPTAVLGRTGIEVTRLGFGGATGRLMSDEDADSLLNGVVDYGINFLDTANDYTNSEYWIGRSLSHRYEEIKLATKCGCSETTRPGTRNSSVHVWTRDNLFRGIEQSLQRLKRESVDLIQLHNATVEECESGGLVRALTDMRDQGLVKWIGMSTTLPHLPVYLDWGVFDTFQIPYSALERQHEEWITRSAAAGIGTIIRGGVASGEPGVGSGRADRWDTYGQARLDELLEDGETPSAFMFRFTLTHPDVHTIIVGTTNPEHLRENVDAVGRGPLSADLYREAKRRLDEAGESPETAS